VSVGHVQRAIETVGIPTVSIMVDSFAHIPGLMNLPRTLVTPHPMGRPTGAPHDIKRQSEVVAAALDLFTSDDQVHKTFPGPYRSVS
jgi:hypothetical protein